MNMLATTPTAEMRYRNMLVACGALTTVQMLRAAQITEVTGSAAIVYGCGCSRPARESGLYASLGPQVIPAPTSPVGAQCRNCYLTERRKMA